MKKVFLLSLITFYVQAQTLYFNNYDSLGKNDKVVTNATFEGLATTTMVSEAVASLVPTNRTITIGSQVGSLQTNLVFASTGAGVTEPTVTNIAQAVVDANVPTLAEVASSGGFAGTETISPLNISLGGYFQALLGDGASTIDSSAKGASQSGLNYGSLSIGANSHGASQSGDNFGGSQSIGDSSHGASQSGYNEYLQSIGDSSHGASQSGLNYGSLSIGANSHGAMQRGQLLSADSSAINNAAGAVQIFSLTNGQHALTTTDGAASLLIGAGTISNKNTIVVGDNEYSHGQGSVTAGGGFFGSGIGITINGTNIQDAINQRVEKSNGTATNLSVFSSLTLLDKTITWNSSRQTFDVPLYGGVVGQLFQENLMLVRNQTGANIGNGKIVCSAGAVGDNSAIRKASSSDASCAWGVLGMVTQDAGIDHGSDGLICTGGEVNNLPLPTSIYQPSNTLWLATDGNYTNVEPQNVAVKYQIGIVLRAHATEGRIQFHPQFIPSPASIGAASASNATLTGTATINGDTLIGAAAITNAIIENSNFFATMYGYGSITSTVAGAYLLTNALPVGGLTTITNSATTNNAYVARFVTGTGLRFTRITGDRADVHFHASKGAAGAATLKPELYILNALGGKKVEYETAASTPPLTTSFGDYNIQIPLPSNIVISATDRLGVFLKATVTSGSPTIYVGTEDALNFSLSVPIPSVEIVTQPQLTNYYTRTEIDARPSGAQTIVKDAVISTNVVRVVSTQSVYVATVTSPCVITQDVSALTLATNQTAFWTTRINVTDWSATNGITFATNIAAYAGDFTVTGCYDFACSLLCDGRIEMRQTFPTVYPWMKTPTSAAGGNTTSEICTFDRKALLTLADTSKSFVAEIPCVTCPYIVRTLFYVGAASSWTNNVSFSAGLVWFGNSENGSALYSTNAISTNATNFKITYNYVPSITLQPTTSARLYFNATKTLLAGGINFFPVEYRQANENEIRAYNNGWRPQ